MKSLMKMVVLMKRICQWRVTLTHVHEILKASTQYHITRNIVYRDGHGGFTVCSNMTCFIYIHIIYLYVSFRNDGIEVGYGEYDDEDEDAGGENMSVQQQQHWHMFMKYSKMAYSATLL